MTATAKVVQRRVRHELASATVVIGARSELRIAVKLIFYSRKGGAARNMLISFN